MLSEMLQTVGRAVGTLRALGEVSYTQPPRGSNSTGSRCRSGEGVTESLGGTGGGGGE